MLLGFTADVPCLFEKLREQTKRRDKYAKIDFVRLQNEGDEIIDSKF